MRAVQLVVLVWVRGLGLSGASHDFFLLLFIILLDTKSIHNNNTSSKNLAAAASWYNWASASFTFIFQKNVEEEDDDDIRYPIYPRKQTDFLKTYLYPGLGRENVPISILKAEYVLSMFSTYYAYTP